MPSKSKVKTDKVEIGPILTPANGQGIVFFTTANASQFYIFVTPQKGNIEEYFRLRVSTTEAVLDFKVNGQDEVIIRKSTDTKDLVDKGILTTYWLSFSTTYDEKVKKYIPDLRYGKGFAMEKTTLMSEKLNQLKFLGVSTLFTCKTEKYARVYQDVVSSSAEDAGVLDVEPRVYLSKTPLTYDPSPVAIDSASASMLDIDLGRTLSTMLPDKARTLFDTVKNFEISDTLVNAIRFSLTTPGMTLYSIAEDKMNSADGFGTDEVYIRVTVGKDSKIGPGIPFVLEIWPSGMKSPIHDHGDSVAVIKVLHGQINIDIYNKLVQPESYPTEADILQSFAPTKGQFTWMNKNWYQVHQLKNVTEDYCATIQCYLYDDSDRVHWPGFDFVEANSSDVEIFNPESDLDYKVMCAKVLQEYYRHEYPLELRDRTMGEGPRQRKKRKLQDS